MNKLIEERYSIWVDKLKYYIPEEYIEDVLDTVLLSMLNNEKDIRDFGCPDCYIVNACKLAFYSKNSPYNRIQGKHIHTVELDESYDEPEPEKDEAPIDVIKIIDNSPFCWWEKELFKRKVLEDKTLKDMSEECNLTIGQIWYSYNKMRKWLKKNIDIYGKEEEC